VEVRSGFASNVTCSFASLYISTASQLLEKKRRQLSQGSTRLSAASTVPRFGFLRPHLSLGSQLPGLPQLINERHTVTITRTWFLQVFKKKIYGNFNAPFYEKCGNPGCDFVWTTFDSIRFQTILDVLLLSS
jgi:hypothetical protein